MIESAIIAHGVPYEALFDLQYGVVSHLTGLAGGKLAALAQSLMPGSDQLTGLLGWNAVEKTRMASSWPGGHVQL